MPPDPPPGPVTPPPPGSTADEETLRTRIDEARGDAYQAGLCPNPRFDPGGPQVIGPQQSTVLFNGFRPLFQALDPQSTNEVAYELIQTLQGEGGTLEALMQRTASLTNTLADRDAVIGRVITNLSAVLDTLDGPVKDAGNSVMRPLGAAGQKQLIALLDRLRAGLHTPSDSK